MRYQTRGMTLTTALVGMCILLPVGLSAQSRNDPKLPEVPYSYSIPQVAVGLDLSVNTSLFLGRGDLVADALAGEIAQRNIRPVWLRGS